jgi:archaeosine-15-forming tRNA-guanine transglycosylase
VLHGAAQFVEHGLDVTLLDARLRLDEVGQFLGLDEVLVVDRRGEPLAIGRLLIVLVLNFLEFLTHCVFLSYLRWCKGTKNF